MGALSSLANVGLDVALAQRSARQEQRDIDRDRDRQIAQIQERSEEQRRQQQETLRRRLSAQRARAGAAGVGGSASSRAVIRGLVEEASNTQTAEDDAAATRIDAIRGSARSSSRRNLLDLVGGSTRSGLGALGSGRSLFGF